MQISLNLGSDTRKRHLSRQNSRTLLDLLSKPWIKSPIAWKSHKLQCFQWSVHQAHLSLHKSTEISCAGLNGDLCTVYKNSECCCEAASATKALLCNHQCFVSMLKKCSQCDVIKFLNKTFASLPRKNTKWLSFIGCYFMGI